MKNYRISIGNNLKSLTLVFGFILALIGFNIYGSKYYSYYNFNTFLLSTLAFIPWVIPAIFIHVEYLMRNWKATLEIDRPNQKLRYQDEEKDIEADFDEITQVVKHQAKDTALLYGFYEYYKIYLKSGESLIITILITRKLSIPGVQTEIVDRYFPSVWLYDNVSSK